METKGGKAVCKAVECVCKAVSECARQCVCVQGSRVCVQGSRVCVQGSLAVRLCARPESSLERERTSVFTRRLPQRVPLQLNSSRAFQPSGNWKETQVVSYTILVYSKLRQKIRGTW